MSRTDSGHGTPRAVIHKRILDVAASSPDASMEAIADEVPGATTDLVERVFEEYGDPVGDSTDPDETPAVSTTDQTEDASTTDQTAPDQTEPTTMQENGDQATGDATAAGIDPSSLTNRQRETLRVVHDHPEWSQADVAERLGVSRATVSRRLNDLPGFEWADRESFTAEVFDDEPGTGEGSEAGGDASDGDAGVAATTAHAGTAEVADPEAVSELDDRLDTVEAQIEDMDGSGYVEEFDDRLEAVEAQVAEIDSDGGDSDMADGRTRDLPPELAHKVVHACVHSERISEDEELRIIETLLAR